MLVLQPHLGRREGRQEVLSQALRSSFSFLVLVAALCLVCLYRAQVQA